MTIYALRIEHETQLWEARKSPSFRGFVPRFQKTRLSKTVAAMMNLPFVSFVRYTLLLRCCPYDTLSRHRIHLQSVDKSRLMLERLIQITMQYFVPIFFRYTALDSRLANADKRARAFLVMNLGFGDTVSSPPFLVTYLFSLTSPCSTSLKKLYLFLRLYLTEAWILCANSSPPLSTKFLLLHPLKARPLSQIK